ILISQFKRDDGFGVGLNYNRAPFEYGKVGESSGLKPSEKPSPSSLEPSKPSGATPSLVVDGVFQEPTKEPPKNHVWTEKPNHLRNPLDTLPPMARKKSTPKPKAKPQSPPKQPPQPKRVVYQCEYCDREGHLEEFCFRRKRDERREREQKDKDTDQGVREPSPKRSVRQPAQPRGVREFARHAPSRERYDLGQHGRGFESRRDDRPRFAGRGDRRSPRRRGGSVDIANPTVEQMARHWFYTHPSVEASVRVTRP